MESINFGKGAYYTFFIFNVNVNYSIRTVELYSILVKKLDGDLIKHGFDDKQMLRVKQQIVLDMLSRLMSIIESTFVLLYGIKQGYEKIPKIMTYYELTAINSTINNIQKRKFNMRKILGFCDLSKIELSDIEKRVVAQEYKKTSTKIYDMLDNLVKFYEEYKIIYGKTKHGLSYYTGGGNLDSEIKFENSIVIALHKQELKKMPKNTIISDNKLGIDIPWYNVQSVLKINDNLFKTMGELIHNLPEIVKYVCHNHLTFAENCGENYLPYLDNNSKIGIGAFYGDPPSDNDQEILTKLNLKILPLMYCPNRQLHYGFNTDDEKIKKSIKEDVVTNFWLKNTK